MNTTKVRPRILLVDENPGDRQLIQTLWSTHLPEFELRAVSNEETFQEELQSLDFDLVILDYFFAGFHGLTMLQRLRQAAPRIPVIFFCGALESGIEQKILEAGPDDFLYKNSTGFLLLPKLVKRHLARARLGVRAQDLPMAGLRRLLDRAYLGFFQADTTGRLLDATPALLKMFEAESVAQLRDLGYSWTAPGVVRDSTNSAEPTPSSYEIELRTVQGNQRWYSIALEVYGEDREARKFVGVVSDITDRRRLQTQVAEMEQRVKRLTQETTRQQAEGQHQAVDLNDLASIAAQQLHQPVRDLRESTRVLVDDYIQKLDTQGQESLFSAHESTRQIYEAVEELLQLIKSGGKLEKEECDSNWIVEEAVLNLKTLVDEKRAQISWDRLPSIHADRRQLRLVFQNLVSNAIKFYRGPDVPIVKIWSEPAGEEVRFLVKDNGVGIDHHLQETIFQPFSRQSLEIPGLGLGLAISRRIVEKHGGRIWVESTPGTGSIFVFSIPVKMAENQTRHSPTERSYGST